jgi:hypothetical protein
MNGNTVAAEAGVVLERIGARLVKCVHSNIFGWKSWCASEIKI